jgi:hypothetical protein
LFLGYHKLISKNLNSQLGFSSGLIAVEGIMILTVLGWAIYRLVLLIRETDTWKQIYYKMTENKDPNYLK